MEYKCLVLETDGPIATVTFNRPESGNSFDFRSMEELDHVLRHLDKDDGIRVVIITGAGKYFCTGVDLKMFANSGSLEDNDKKREAALSRVREKTGEEPWGEGTIAGAVVTMTTTRKAMIAAVNGPAVGLGFSLALACDIRIASDRASFSAMFVKRGLAPDTGGSFTLPRVVGFPKAYELMLTGDTIDAAEAERIGAVNKVVPHDKLMGAARELAGKIVKNPPLAVAVAKEALNSSMAETNIMEQLKREVDYQVKLFKTEDFQEAARAFVEKRDPVFKGR